MSEDDDRDPAEAVQEKRLLESMDRDREVAELAELLKQEPFRDLLWRVLEHCNMFRSTFDANYGRMALQEGQRQIGIWLVNEIAIASPPAWMEMQQKAQRATQAEAQKRSTESAGRRRRVTKP